MLLKNGLVAEPEYSLLSCSLVFGVFGGGRHMLQIMTALCLASPLLMGHRLIVAFGFWAKTVCRLVLGFVIAALVYFGVILALVKTYPRSEPLSVIVYGFGFALAVRLAGNAGALISPTRLSRIIVPGIYALAPVFPLGLYFYFGSAGDWRGTYILYVVGSIGGGYGITRLMSWAREDISAPANGAPPSAGPGFCGSQERPVGPCCDRAREHAWG
jgi:hypothetical protein